MQAGLSSRCRTDEGDCWRWRPYHRERQASFNIIYIMRTGRDDLLAVVAYGNDWDNIPDPDLKTSKLPPVGNTAYVAQSSYSNSIGDTQLSARFGPTRISSPSTLRSTTCACWRSRPRAGPPMAPRYWASRHRQASQRHLVLPGAQAGPIRSLGQPMAVFGPVSSRKRCLRITQSRISLARFFS